MSAPPSTMAAELRRQELVVCLAAMPLVWSLLGHTMRSATRAERSILKGQCCGCAVSLCHSVLSWTVVLLSSAGLCLGPEEFVLNLCSPSSHPQLTDLPQYLIKCLCAGKLQILFGSYYNRLHSIARS